MIDYRIQAPQLLRDFLSYHQTIQGHSQKTVDEYFLDLRNFFRYIKIEKGLVARQTAFDEISIMDVDISLIRSVSLTDVYSYLSFLSNSRARNAKNPYAGSGLMASTRAIISLIITTRLTYTINIVMF